MRFLLRHIPAYLLSLSAAAFWGGCSIIYDYDNCPPCGNVDFELVADWRLAPSADPEGMAYLFFSPQHAEPWRFDFPGREGGTLSLPQGCYNMLSFNDDTSGVLFENIGSYSGLTCTTRVGGLYDGLGGTIHDPLGPAQNDNGEPVHICPDMMWGDALEGVVLDTAGDRVVVSTPSQITPVYRYIVSPVTRTEGISRVCAALSGMAPSVRLADRFRGTGPVTMPLAASVDGDRLHGEFVNFGVPSEGCVPNMLSVFVWLTDGTKLRYDFDVTEQIDAAPDPYDVTITVGGIDLPESKPSAGSGGTDVTVDGWTVIVTDIKS